MKLTQASGYRSFLVKNNGTYACTLTVSAVHNIGNFYEKAINVQ